MSAFEEMNWQEKREHIWEYYKLHMAGAAAVLLLIGSLLNIYLINPAPDVILDVTIRVPLYDYNADYSQTLKAMLTEEVVLNTESQEVQVELLQTDASDPNTVMAVEAKFMGKAEVQELDLIVADEENFKYMLSEGYFMDIEALEKQFGITIPEELKVYSTDPATQDKRVLSLDADQMPGLAAGLMNDDTEYFVGIFIRSIAEENAMKALLRLSE